MNKDTYIMAKMQITESELKQVIAESLVEVINENIEDEGFLDKIKSAVSGAKNAWNTQSAFDNSASDYQDYGAVKNHENFFDKRPDAIDGKNGIRDMLTMARDYEAKARKLRRRVAAMAKYQGIEKDEKGNYKYDHAASPVFNMPKREKKELPLKGRVGTSNLA